MYTCCDKRPDDNILLYATRAPSIPLDRHHNPSQPKRLRAGGRRRLQLGLDRFCRRSARQRQRQRVRKQPCQQMLAVTLGARQNGRLTRKAWVARQQLVTGAQLPGSVHPLEAVAPTHRRPSTQVRAAATVGRGALHTPRARGPSLAPHCAPAARSTPVGTFRASSLSKGPVAPAS
jgi:hypothetical protein